MKPGVALAWVVRVAAVGLGGVLIVVGVQTFLFMGIVGLFAGTLTGAMPALQGVALGLGVTVGGGWLVDGGLRDFPRLRAFVRP